MFKKLVLGLGLIASTAFGALYEPNDGQILYGPWYDRLNGATPVGLNKALGFNASLFQSDINVTMDGIQSDAVDQMTQQILDTKTDAFLYLTVFTYTKASSIPDSSWDLLADKIKQVVDKGIRVLLRPLSEMNGNWFAYGQQPTTYRPLWIKIHDKIKSKTSGVAFVWAPNAANGYPFPGGRYAAARGSADYEMMDTNKDGVVDLQDDPYSIYYPGDEYVDWVGYTCYHYGAQWPWETNDLPRPGEAESILTGHNADSGPFHFYNMFSANKAMKREKPFIITETSAPLHTMKEGRAISPGDGELNIKRNWWNQLFNKTLLANYPKIKAISSFEFVKFEETTWRDFRLIKKENGIVDAFVADIVPLKIIAYANYTTNPTAGGKNNTTTNGTNNAYQAYVPSLLPLILCLISLLL